MEIRLIRHATMLVDWGGVKILLDPVFSPAGAMPPIDNSPRPRPNPLVSLPLSEQELLDADAVLLTHTHRDHFDECAGRLIPKDKQMFCQPEDEAKLKELGFRQVMAIKDSLTWRSLTVSRTGGRHGSGEIGEKMGPVSGYVLAKKDQPTLYVAGDTVWCGEVQEALTKYRPDVVVLFAGAAQFLSGGPITMDYGDVVAVCRQSPAARVIAVHMESFNHCLLSRRRLEEELARENLLARVSVPLDGEVLRFEQRAAQ